MDMESSKRKVPRLAGITNRELVIAGVALAGLGLALVIISANGGSIALSETALTVTLNAPK